MKSIAEYITEQITNESFYGKTHGISFDGKGPFYYCVSLRDADDFWDGWAYDIKGKKTEWNEEGGYPKISNKTAADIEKEVQKSIKLHKYPTKTDDEHNDVKYISIMVGEDPNDTSDWKPFIVFDVKTGNELIFNRTSGQYE